MHSHLINYSSSKINCFPNVKILDYFNYCICTKATKSKSHSKLQAMQAKAFVANPCFMQVTSKSSEWCNYSHDSSLSNETVLKFTNIFYISETSETLSFCIYNLCMTFLNFHSKPTKAITQEIKCLYFLLYCLQVLLIATKINLFLYTNHFASK